MKELWRSHSMLKTLTLVWSFQILIQLNNHPNSTKTCLKAHSIWASRTMMKLTVKHTLKIITRDKFQELTTQSMILKDFWTFQDTIQKEITIQDLSLLTVISTKQQKKQVTTSKLMVSWTPHRNHKTFKSSTSRRTSQKPSRRCWLPTTCVRVNLEASTMATETVTVMAIKNQAPSMTAVLQLVMITWHNFLRLNRSLWRKRLIRSTNGWKSCTKRMMISVSTILRINMTRKCRLILSWELRKKTSDNCKSLWP